MALFSGAMTYMRYRVEGELPDNWTDKFERSIEVRRFMPLDADSEDVESVGWVPVRSPFADEEPITNAHFLLSSWLVLGYREDQFAFPKPLLRDRVASRMELHREKTGMEATGQTKRAIEAAVMAELRKKILPRSRVIELCWDMQNKQLRIFTRSVSITDRMVKLFEQTFDVRLKHCNYVEQAVVSELSSTARSALETLVPQNIFQEMTHAR